ncbi:unnamed protein product [Heterobilharzia americana]|nr:unnamed protein product [Heterobilharzia americana]
MNPRRRFSSHPVECNGLYIDYLTGCEHNAKFPSNCLYSQLTKSHYDTASDTFESSSSSKQEKVPKSDKNLPIHSMDQFKSHNCINLMITIEAHLQANSYPEIILQVRP